MSLNEATAYLINEYTREVNMLKTKPSKTELEHIIDGVFEKNVPNCCECGRELFYRKYGDPVGAITDIVWEYFNGGK